MNARIRNPGWLLPRLMLITCFCVLSLRFVFVVSTLFFFWASSFPPPLSPSLRHHAVLLGVADAVIVIFLRRFFPLES